MEACEEVADWEADTTDVFSSRLSSLNLSCTSQTFDPAFTFDTSSRSSSLRHCESTSRSAATDIVPTAAPTILASVSPIPREPYRRHITVARRSSLPSGDAEEAALSHSASEWSPSPSVPAGPATLPAPAAAGSASCHGGVDYGRGLASFVGTKRRSCPDPSSVLQPMTVHQRDEESQPAACSEALPSLAPNSPANSFASFAAALAARYYADFGNVPDVPAHFEEVRLRTSKRQRVFSLEQLADA